MADLLSNCRLSAGSCEKAAMMVLALLKTSAWSSIQGVYVIFQEKVKDSIKDGF